MKKVLNKVSEILSWIFGYGMMICLFVGGLSFIAYLVALIVGGDTAVLICDFVYKKLYKYLVYVTSTLVLLGLLKMYLSGQTALTSGRKKKVKVKVEQQEEQVVQKQTQEQAVEEKQEELTEQK